MTEAEWKAAKVAQKEAARKEKALKKELEEARAELAASYVREIGYDPFQDDPKISMTEVAQTLGEFRAECALAGRN